jgi:hypothetical protein
MEADLRLFIWSYVMQVCSGHCHQHDRAGLKPVHDDLSPAPQPEAEPDKQPSSTAYTDLEAALEPLAAAACPEVDAEEAAFRLLILELEEWCGFDTSAAVSACDLAAVLSPTVSAAMICPHNNDTPPESEDDFGPFAAAVAAALSPTVPEARPFADKASTELPLVEVDADLSLLVVTYCDYALAVAIEQCVLLPAVSDASSTLYTESSSSRRRTVSGAKATGHRLIPRQFKSSFQSLCASRRRLSIYSTYISSVYHSAEFMQPLVLTIIIATHCIVLAIKDCAVLSIYHTGCDPPLRDHYCKPWMSARIHSAEL